MITIEKLIELRDDAVAHYDAMMTYAGMQPADKNQSDIKMLEDIGEQWHAEDCAFCKTFKFCSDCILLILGSCCNTLWSEMNESRTWREWIIAAQNVKQFIIDRVREEIEKIKQGDIK